VAYVCGLFGVVRIRYSASGAKQLGCRPGTKLPELFDIALEPVFTQVQVVRLTGTYHLVGEFLAIQRRVHPGLLGARKRAVISISLRLGLLTALRGCRGLVSGCVTAVPSAGRARQRRRPSIFCRLFDELRLPLFVGVNYQQRSSDQQFYGRQEIGLGNSSIYRPPKMVTSG
jgi:hypothetical protein